MMNYQEFGQFLRTMRKKKGLTLKQLGEITGLSHPYLSQIENGKRNPPSPEILRTFANSLGVMFEELLAAAGYWDEDEPLTPIDDKNDQREIKQKYEKIRQRQESEERKNKELTHILEQPGITFNLHPLNDRDRKRITDMLNTLFPDYQ